MLSAGGRLVVGALIVLSLLFAYRNYEAILEKGQGDYVVRLKRENTEIVDELLQLYTDLDDCEAKWQKREENMGHEQDTTMDGKEEKVKAPYIVDQGQGTTRSENEKDETEVQAPPLSLNADRGKLAAHRPGLVILGMHRSGTSVVAGLVSNMGLATGGNLLPPKDDNKKGFFERHDMTLQNDAFLRRQSATYLTGVENYNAAQGLRDVFTAKGMFSEGRKTLNFLNKEANYPWVLKDPRLCITFRTWLSLMNFVPAVLFTYRHPLDVALSFAKRFEKLPIEEGLRLWYVYNRRAVEQSHDLCRMVTSYKAVMSQPKVEMDRIFEEARECGVPVPHTPTEAVIEKFVDVKLQHGKVDAQTEQSCSALSSLTLPSFWHSKDPENDLLLYRVVMRAYCALEDRSAFRSDFQWDKSIRSGPNHHYRPNS